MEQPQTLPLIDGVVWKQVRDLKVGDEVKDWGPTLYVSAPSVPQRQTIISWRRAIGTAWWPSDAWVPVLVKPVVYEQTRRTTNPFIARDWRESTQGCVIQDVEYGEVAELRGDQ